MNAEQFFKRLLPHIVAVIIFIIVCFAFLFPILQGKVVRQNDVAMFNGSFQEVREYQKTSGERSLWTNSMFGGMPTYQIAPYSPKSMLGTMPVYNVLVSGWGLPAPANALFLYCLGFYLLLLSFRVNQWLAVAGALAYGFSSFNIIIIEAGHMLQALVLGSAPMVIAAAVYIFRHKKYLLGGSLFALAFAINLRTSHIQMTYYMGIFLGIYVLAELIMSLMHGRIASYAKSLVTLILAAGIAACTSITLQLTSYEYGNETIRGKSDLKPVKTNNPDPDNEASTGLARAYAFQHSYDVGEAFVMMIPNFRGGASLPLFLENNEAGKKVTDENLAQIVASHTAYWGGQDYTSGPMYLGAVICFLFVLALFTYKSEDRWWLLAITIVSILLAMGRFLPGLNYFIFDHVPMYNKFRSIAFTLVMAGISVPLLAMLGLDNILKNYRKWDKNFTRNFYIAFALTGGLCLLFFMAPGMAGSLRADEKKERNNIQQTLGQMGATQADLDAFFKSDAYNRAMSSVEDERASLVSSDAGRSFLYILLSGGLLFLFGRGTLKDPKLVIVGIGALVLVDLYSAGKRFLHDDKDPRRSNFEPKRDVRTTQEPSAADMEILKDKDPDYRVLNVSATDGNNPFNDATTSYFHKSIGGYHGAKLRRFQEMRDRTDLDQAVGVIGENMARAPQRDMLMMQFQQMGYLNVLDMMNVKYFIVGNGTETKDVVRNPYALGSAWFVKAVREVPDADAEVNALRRLDAKDTAVVDLNTRKEFKAYMEGFKAAPDPSASITLTKYAPNQVSYKTKAAAEQFAVFSEVYYNSGLGWNAYLDGKKVEHIRTDFLLRGMRVPAGEHEIVFKFEPKSYATGEMISMISSLIMLLALIAAIVLEVRNANKKEEAPKAA